MIKSDKDPALGNARQDTASCEERNFLQKNMFSCNQNVESWTVNWINLIMTFGLKVLKFKKVTNK